VTNSYQTESAPRLFINGEPATDDTAPNRKYYKPSAEESEIQRLYSATDDKGNLRFTVDPEYREQIANRLNELQPVVNQQQGLEPTEPETLVDYRSSMERVLDQEEIEEFLNATDRYGNQRMSVDPDFRKAVYEYFERKYPDAAKPYVEIID